MVKAKTVLSLLNIKTEHELFPVVATEGYTTAEGRNYCVVQAIKNNCSHILFVDDDMTFPSDTIDRLLAHAKDIVGVYSYSRVLPLSPTVGFLDANGEYLPQDRMAFVKKPETLFKCYTVGMGVALINMELFNKIEKPWFYFQTHDNGAILIGEDAWLCKQARDKGIEIWCDPTLEVGHIGDYEYKQ